mgnify:CR=1 FL=1
MNEKFKKLYIAVPNYRGWIEAPHHLSMLHLFHFLGSRGCEPHYINPVHTVLSTARQTCVNAACAEPGCEYILFIDDDMVFVPEQVAMLMNEVAENDLDFLSALAFSNSIPTKPCIFGKSPAHPEHGEVPWWYIVTDYPKAQRFEVLASGFGMAVISTRMLKAMREGVENYQHFHYNHPLCPNEDVSFCLSARDKGFKLYCDSRVSIGHVSKDRPIITEDVYISQGAAAEYNMNMTPMKFKEGSVELEHVSS